MKHNKFVIVAIIAMLGAGILLSIRLSRTEIIQDASTAPVYAQEQEDEQVTEPEPKVAEKAPKPLTWQDNPNKCTDDQWIGAAEPFRCIDKPVEEVQSVASAPVTPPAQSYGSGSCQTEIAKYDWDQSTALAVAQAESGFNTGVVNNNPATGDYSIGCFQINIFGGNAANRPSEAELKNAATNVAFAYQIYSANGQSFIGQWGVCRSIACY